MLVIVSTVYWITSIFYNKKHYRGGWQRTSDGYQKLVWGEEVKECGCHGLIRVVWNCPGSTIYCEKLLLKSLLNLFCLFRFWRPWNMSYSPQNTAGLGTSILATLKQKMQKIRDELDKYKDMYDNKCHELETERGRRNEVWFLKLFIWY